jgi:hypothetical protein
MAEKVSWTEFLEATPPGAEPLLVRGSTEAFEHKGATRYRMAGAILSLRCESCNGTRRFEHRNGHTSLDDDDGVGGIFLLRFYCRDCTTTRRVFCITWKPTEAEDEFGLAKVQKLAEWPPFGGKVSREALELIEPDKPLFFKGRTCENRGLGIGAMAYYRRVVENQKVHIIDSILSAAKKLNVPEETLKELQEARDSWRFSDSVERVKDAIPESLRIDGQNPLLLLHDALSAGLHDEDDSECLKQAEAIRVVLGALAERIRVSLAEKATVSDALKLLMKRREEREERERQKKQPL